MSKITDSISTKDWVRKAKNMKFTYIGQDFESSISVDDFKRSIRKIGRQSENFPITNFGTEKYIL